MRPDTQIRMSELFCLSFVLIDTFFLYPCHRLARLPISYRKQVICKYSILFVQHGFLYPIFCSMWISAAITWGQWAWVRLCILVYLVLYVNVVRFLELYVCSIYVRGASILWMSLMFPFKISCNIFVELAYKKPLSIDKRRKINLQACVKCSWKLQMTKAIKVQVSLYPLANVCNFTFSQ